MGYRLRLGNQSGATMTAAPPVEGLGVAVLTPQNASRVPEPTRDAIPTYWAIGSAQEPIR